MRRTPCLWLVLLAALGGLSFLDVPVRPRTPLVPASNHTADASLPNAAWLVQAQHAIEKKEYEASTTDLGLQAPNRAHDLRTWFGPSGIRVVDRTADGTPELLALRVARLGRANRATKVGEGQVRHAGARVEIRRQGWTEWFENSDAGLEQGFTLSARPAGEGPVVVDLVIAGAMVERTADGATFVAGGGRRLHYGELAAFDARGTVLAAAMDIEADGIRLRVEDAGAEYPITIDPLLTAVADARLDGQQTSAEFGRAVACAGDVNGDGYADVIVGAQMYDAGQTNEGVAFVYHGGPGGIPNNATPAATIQSNQASAILGFCATSAGDVNGDGYDDIIVCDYGYNWGGNLLGAAFVFHGSATGINPNASPANANATLKNDQTFVSFAISAASAGDVNGDGYADVIVGCEDYNVQAGAAFVFHGSAAGIVGTTAANAATRLTSTQGGARFGRSVAGAGDVNGDGYADVVVGAYRYDAGQTDEGEAFVYLGGAGGIASVNENSAAAHIEGNLASAHLGLSVDGAGDVNGDGYSDLVLGAPAFVNGQTGEGAAFLVHGSAAGIPTGSVTGVSTSFIESNQVSATLGTMVRGAGDVNGDGYADVIIGAEAWDSGESNEGGAFVCYGSPNGVPNGSPSSAGVTVLQANQANAFFGVSVAGAGDFDGDGYADVIVGAFHYDVTATDEGSAFLYRGGAQGMVGTFDFNANGVAYGQQFNSGFASVVAGAGDVNGDGYSDVLVGGPLYDLGETDEGAVFLYLGSADGMANPATASATFESNQATALLGCSVAGAGDVNGDGYADILLGARLYDQTETDEGAAFLFLGSTSGIASGDPVTAATVLVGGQANAWFGRSVASAGDVNGDGYPDVVVGASRYASGHPVEGCAFVFAGSASGVANGSGGSAAWRLEADQSFAEFGTSVACAGDVNGDGYADVIVGAPSWDSGNANDEGGAFVFHGGPSGIADGHAPSAATTLQSDDNFALFGNSVAGAGDVNGDGYADVIVGSPGYGASDPGAWFVFHGSASGVPSGNPSTANTFLTGGSSYQLGTSVAGVGDVNGDGYADVAIGAPMSGGTGLCLIYVGSATGIVSNGAQAVIQSASSGAQLGTSVAGAGDVNGDGFADVIAGAPGNGSSSASIYHGGGGTRHRGARVFTTRADGSGQRVLPWSTTVSPGAFRANAEAVHTGGRGRVKLEVEHCPPGVPFGSGSCTRTITPTWLDATAPGTPVAITQDIAITPGSLRRWRARTLRAPYTVTAAGITAPPKPAHGPWFRPLAQSVEADVRTALAVTAVHVAPDAGGLAIEHLVNPSRGAVSFVAALPGNGLATAELFDVAGRRLGNHVWQPAASGRELVRWANAPHLEAGVYHLRLRQGSRMVSASVVVVR